MSPKVIKPPLFAGLKVRGLEVARSANAEVRVQAIAPADFPKGFEAFERLPSGQLGEVEFSRELDFFVEKTAADVGLAAVHDTIVNAGPLPPSFRPWSSRVSRTPNQLPVAYFPFHHLASQDFEVV